MAAAARVLLGAERPWVANRAHLGDVPVEGQADGPVDHGADLARRARDLAHVVGAREPPGGKAAKRASADLRNGLVATEVFCLKPKSCVYRKLLIMTTSLVVVPRARTNCLPSADHLKL